MTYQPQETELPLLHHGRHQDQQESRRLASSSHSPAQTASILANNTMDDPRLTSWPRPIGRDLQEQSVRDGYTTDTSSSTQNVAVPSTRPNIASENSRSKLLRPKEIPVHTEQDGDEKWQPFWLRPAVLGIFSTFFLCCAVVLPVLLSLSQKNDGLLEARKDLEQLWRFGPTAVLTVITIFWGRVELQTLRYFPWVQSRNSNDSSLYMLDYTSKISITVLVQSLRNKHFLVSIITLTTLLLKVQIILMPSLFFLENVKVSKPITIQTWDFFDPDFSHPTANKLQPLGYYNARAIRDFDTGIPFGVGNSSIYQNFSPENTAKGVRGTDESPVTAIVDGLFVDVECRELKSYSSTLKDYVVRDEPPLASSTLLEFDLEFEGCDQTIKVNASSSIWSETPSGWEKYAIWKPATVTANCSALPNQFGQFVYLATELVPSPKNRTIPIPNACAAVICSHTAWVSKVEVWDDGNNPRMTVLPDQAKTPIKTNPYGLILNSVPEQLGGYDSLSQRKVFWGPGGNFSITIDRSPLEINAYIFESTSVTEKYNASFPDELYTNQALYEAVLNLTQTLGPLVTHHQLRNETESQTKGSRLIEIPRLKLSQPICIALAVLSGLSAIVSLWSMLKYKGAFRNWDRNPATILGLMTFFHSDRLDPLLEQRETRSRSWSQFLSSPLPLPNWLRLIFTIYVSGLIISLVILLQMSNTSSGIITLKEGTLSLWWTVVPTLAIYLVTLYTTSSDTVVRDLAIYSTLSDRSCTTNELDVSLLDMLGFRALYYSLRWKIYTVTLSQLLAIACGFLAPFSSLLFISKNLPGQTDITFKQQSWFGSRAQVQETEIGKLNETMRTRYAVNGLLVTQKSSNFTWPAFTYQNLIFPRLEIDGPSQDWNSSVRFELEAPAVQLRPECRQLSQDILKWTITHYSWIFNLKTNLPRTCPNGTTINPESFMSPIDDTYILQELAPMIDPCPADYWIERTYIWGHVKKNITYRDGFEHVSIWSCNYTWAEIPTKLNMLWGANGLQVDHQNPPSPDYSRARPLYPPLKTPNFNKSEATTGEWPDQSVGDLRGGELSTNIDGRFLYLFEPIGSIKVTDLIDPNQDRKILEALHYGTSVIAAQLANDLNRLGIEEPSILSPEHPGELAPISVKVTDHRRVRLVQNSQTTYFILSVLSLGFLVNSWALISTGLRHFVSYRGKWLLDLEMRDLVPTDYNSIAMSAALLAPSNYSKYMGSLNELYTGLTDRHFRMGWFIRRGGQERELTIGVLDDPDFLFLGKKQANG